jgi:hypothetical protein
MSNDRAPGLIASRVVCRCLFVFLAGMIATATASAQPGAPTYSGEVCLSGSTATVSVTAAPTATAILIYPNPPGGGYFMTNDGAGNYSASFSGLPAGTQFSFHLVIQIPQQYEFQTHTLTLEPGCTAFGSDGDPGDDDPGDDDGGGIDPGDFGQGGLPHSRAFRHDVVESNGAWSILIETGPAVSPIPGVTGLDVRYRIGDGPMQTEPMANLGGSIWGREMPGATAGDDVSYSFVKTVGAEPVDTSWFERTLGDAAPAIPDAPIETVAALRFRDRHENEWRFDHYPAGYDVGRTFDLRITDHGDRLDFELTTAPEVPVSAVDIKWYNQSGEVGFCDRNISAISKRMDGGNGVFTSTIDNLVHGQRVDVEFTLLAPQTYYSEFIYYYVGDGRLQRESQHPLAYAAGDASIPVVTVKQFAFNQHALNLPAGGPPRVHGGQGGFETRWDDGLLFNPPTAFDCNGARSGSTWARARSSSPGLLGPRYTNNSCIECHMLDGRGMAPRTVADPIEDYIVRLSVPGQPGEAPRPTRCTACSSTPGPSPARRPRAARRSSGSTSPGPSTTARRTSSAGPASSSPSCSTARSGRTSRATPRRARPAGPTPARPRSPSASRPCSSGSGCSRRSTTPRSSPGPTSTTPTATASPAGRTSSRTPRPGRPRSGRFGWKASQPDLRQQTASAFAHDMGMPSWLVGEGPPEVDPAELDAMVAYLRGLAVPPRENHLDPAAQQGKLLFEAAGCVACHRPVMRTAPDAAFAPYRDQVIQPFTDLLLHDMGEGLADGRPEFGASGREWRTPPLWGVGYVGHVLGTPTDPFDPNGDPEQPNYLHDGRARSLMEAILWHGGEADAARDAVLAMDAAERDALIDVRRPRPGPGPGVPVRRPAAGTAGQPSRIGKCRPTRRL